MAGLLSLARTGATEALATAAPEKRADDDSPAALWKRDGPTTIFVGPDQTCGYFGGEQESTLTCNTGLICVVIQMENRANLGCCPGGNPIACPTILPTTWLGLEDAQRSGLCDSQGSCATLPLTGICNKPNTPVAVANTLVAPGADAWVCQPQTTDPLTIMTTYSGQRDAPEWQKIVVDAAGHEMTSSETGAGASATGGGDDGDKDGGGSSAPVGAIVGGVVGGIAVLALIGAGIFIIIRRGKKKDGAARPLSETTMYSGVPSSALPSPAYPKYPSGQGTMPGGGGEHQQQGDEAGRKPWRGSHLQQQTPYGYGPVSAMSQPNSPGYGQFNQQAGGEPPLANIAEADGQTIHELPTVRH